MDESRRRELDRARTLASAPWAEKLKNSPFAKALMGVATRAGYPRRVKIHIVWIGTTLRFEAGPHRLELQPQPDGVAAVFLAAREMIDLGSNPQKLVDRWMVPVDAWRKREAELAAASLAEQAAAEQATNE